MVIAMLVVKFPGEGYKRRYIFWQKKAKYLKDIIVFCQKTQKICHSKSIFYVKNDLNLSRFFIHRTILFQDHFFENFDALFQKCCPILKKLKLCLFKKIL